jgi:hypothetical protein
MDASISNEWELDGCNPKSHQVLCWGLQTMVTCGYLWLNGKILLEEMAWIWILTQSIILYTFLSFREGQRLLGLYIGQSLSTNHPLLFVLGWHKPTPILQIFPSSPLPHHPTSPSKITSMKDFYLLL